MSNVTAWKELRGHNPKVKPTGPARFCHQPALCPGGSAAPGEGASVGVWVAADNKRPAFIFSAQIKEDRSSLPAEVVLPISNRTDRFDGSAMSF